MFRVQGLIRRLCRFERPFRLAGPCVELLEPRCVPAGFNDLVGMLNANGEWWAAASNGEEFTNGSVGVWSPTVAWKDVQVGDFNGDNLDDVVGRNSSDGVWWVALSTGSKFNTAAFGTWSPGVVWSDVRVGDIDNDGKDDIVGREPASGQWWAGVSNGVAFTNRYMGSWSTAVAWVNTQLVDLNADGRADLIGRIQSNGQWWAGLSSGTSFANQLFGAWASSVTWVDVASADLDHDGRADIVGRLSTNGQWWAALSNGSGFTNRYFGSWSPGISWQDMRVGDLDGDGRDDILGRASDSGQWWAGISTGVAFTNRYMGSWSPLVTWLDVRLSDVDNNGRADVIGRLASNGQWWVGLSTGTGFQNRLFGSWSPTTWQFVLVGNFVAPQNLTGAWSLTGVDVDNTTWFADLDLTQSGTALSGHFDWQDASRTAYGREYFTGDFNAATMAVHLVGTSLENAVVIVTGTYDAKIDGFGKSLLHGRWDGSNVIPSQDWRARISNLYASDFASSVDGWTVTGSATQVWASSNGDPGGFLSVSDTGGGGGSQIEAPLAFRRNWRTAAATPGLLSFDVSVDASDVVSSPLAVEISGAGGTARLTLPLGDTPASANWRTYIFVLDSSLWTMLSGDWNALLTSVSSLRIGSDFTAGAESVGFDNIRLLLPT